MNNFHGLNKTHSYFEGWYLKHQNAEGKTVIFIPAFHIDKSGLHYASLQIMTQKDSYYFSLPREEFRANKKHFHMTAGNNLFCTRGIHIDLETKKLTVKGNLYYSPFTPLKYNIMGPFGFMPCMQCNHGIVSLAHSLKGSLRIDDEIIDFTGGRGYIEKDWGTSFPESYFWTQCNWGNEEKNCIMLSVADIPFLRTKFTGCICVVFYKGHEYRFATYLGVKICRYTGREVTLSQGDYYLGVKVLGEESRMLRAPVDGILSREIYESAACRVRYRLQYKNKVIFDFISDLGAFECEGL